MVYISKQNGTFGSSPQIWLAVADQTFNKKLYCTVEVHQEKSQLLGFVWTIGKSYTSTGQSLINRKVF